MQYLSDEMKRRLKRSLEYEKYFPFPKFKVGDREITLPDFVREKGATDPQWSNLFNKICGVIQKDYNPGYDFLGCSAFWSMVTDTLDDIGKRMNISGLPGSDQQEEKHE